MLTQKHPPEGCGLAVRALLAVLFCCCIPKFTYSQQRTADTLKLTCEEAEKLFLERNLPLLAEQLNIDQAEARVLQARTWPNPRLELNDVQLYNTPQTDASPGLAGTGLWRNRTFGAQLEQLVQLAGKRKKNIAFETSNKERALLSFTDFLLSLKAEFRQDIAELIYLQQLSADLQFQFSIIKDLAVANETQYDAGNISQVQLYRLKALQINLQSEINNLKEQVTSKQQSLKTLMTMDPIDYIVIINGDDARKPSPLTTNNLEELLTLSLQHNSAIKVAAGEKKVSEAQLYIEKANAVPDLNLSLAYDRNGNNQLDFLGAGIAIDLPLFNRNKGNIKAAQHEVQKMDVLQKSKTAAVSNQVAKAWTDMNQSLSMFASVDKDYLVKLNEMTNAVSENFRKRNISLLEFLDFFASFKESKQQYYEVIKNIAVKKEELQYLVGQEL